MKNCYSTPAKPFVIGGLELKSCESKTQGDPLRIAIYAFGIILIINIMLLAMEDDNNKIIGYTDDITAGGELRTL